MKGDLNPPCAASVSERARALFSAMLSAPYGDTTTGDIVCAETTRNRLESAWLPILEQALTQQRGEILDRPARVGGRDFKAGELVQRVVGRAHAEYDRHHGGCLRHPYTGELRDYRDVESDPDGTLCVGPGPLAATTPQPSADAVREVPDGMVAMLRECYEWLFDSKSDGPRVSEGAHLKGYYTPEFLDLHTRLSAMLSAASGEGVGK